MPIAAQPVQTLEAPKDLEGCCALLAQIRVALLQLLERIQALEEANNRRAK